MAQIKKVHGEVFKANVVLKLVRGDLTANQIGSQYGVHPTLVNHWRKKLIPGRTQFAWANWLTLAPKHLTSPDFSLPPVVSLTTQVFHILG